MRKMINGLFILMVSILLCIGCFGVTGPSEGENPDGDVVAWFNGLSYTVDLYFPESDELITQAYITGEVPNDIVYLDSDELAVLSSISAELHVFDLYESGSTLATVDLPDGSNPYFMTYDGSNIYISLLYAGQVFVVDIGSLAVTDTLSVPSNPSGVVVADGKLFVSHQNYPDPLFTGGVTVLEISSGAILDTIDTPENSISLRYFEETGKIHVSATTYLNDGTVTIIDPVTLSVAATVNTGGSPGLPVRLDNGTFAAGDGWNSQNIFFYTEDGSVTDIWDTGHNVTGIAATGDTLYFTDFNSDMVFVGLWQQQTVTDSLQAGDGPHGIIFIDR